MQSQRIWKRAVLMTAIAALLPMAIASLAAQQAPAWSRGLQLLPVRVSEASRRAELALQGEGYNITNRSNPSEDSFFLGGQKGPHSAVIMCDRNADGQTWVNIVVASNAGESGVPGLERQRLQARMDDPSMPPSRGGGGPGYGGGGSDPGTGGRGPTGAGTPIGWSTQGNGLSQDPRSTVGQHYTLTLPPGGHAENVWGTDLYTADSRIGTAAVHAGLITFEQGGTVTIEIRPGSSGYRGTFRNGVTTSDFGGAYDLSFAFVGSVTGVASGLSSEPPAQMLTFPGYLPPGAGGAIGSRLTVTCVGRNRADGYLQGAKLYGTDVYTEDSGVCAAAVHSGLMSFETGGTVTIEIRPGQPRYDASTRYGVTSAMWTLGAPRSFVFVRR